MRDFVFDQIFRSTVEGDLTLIFSKVQRNSDKTITKWAS